MKKINTLKNPMIMFIPTLIFSKNDLMETFLFRPEMLISLKAILSL